LKELTGIEIVTSEP